MSDAKDINPRNNNYLIGQEKAEEMFLQAWKSENLHHAWILSGRKGVGKATLAYRITRFMLWANISDKNNYTSLNVPENSPIFKQVSDGSHPDLKVLERGFTETDKRKVIKAIQNGEPMNDDELARLKKSAYIRIDEVREAVDFLSRTSFNDGWRIVIIDSADEMNRNAKVLVGSVVVVSILALLLAGVLFFLHRRNKQLASARNALHDTNAKLASLNEELQQTNSQLSLANEQFAVLNSKLKEANSVKDEYIGRFLSLCSQYVDKLDNYRKMVNKKSYHEIHRVERRGDRGTQPELRLGVPASIPQFH